MYVSTDKADKNGGDGGSGAIDDKHDLVIDVPSNGATPKVGDTESGGTEDKQDLVVDVQSDNATKNGGDTGAGATKDKASQEATAYEGDAESDAKENKHNPVVGVSSVDPTSSGDVESDATTHRRNYLFFGLNISVREPTFDAESVTDYMKTVTSDFESNGVTSDYDGSPAELNGYSAAPGFERKQLFGQKVNPNTANRSNQVPVRQKLYRPPRDSLGRSRPFLKEPIWCLEPIWEAQSPVY
ncbi:uncharacterized protein LOC118479122 [Aplysia californica]|uniref:Uncharacterized protein LOC118479122 n=1 Tax=Aplysia californica TaxID=6500 RepID=A0ABM1W4P6_APLCA|nr:uncharacterized protein LOC118479122 [Aplysia californica]